MGLVAKDTSSGNFKKVPPGAYIGRCISVIDLGTQKTVGQFGEKAQHKIQLRWELFGDDDSGEPLTVTFNGKTMPMTVSKSYTMSLHEKASLRKDLQSWRGKDFTEDEAKGFDISKLLGQYCMVNVTHSESNGKTYSNVAGLTPVPSALKASKPEGVHELVQFDLDNIDMEVFDTFHEKLQQTIQSSPEWIAKQQKPAPKTQAAKEPELEEDDIPFISCAFQFDNLTSKAKRMQGYDY
jgi:hypothetical protein